MSLKKDAAILAILRKEGRIEAVGKLDDLLQAKGETGLLWDED